MIDAMKDVSSKTEESALKSAIFGVNKTENFQSPTARSRLLKLYSKKTKNAPKRFDIA